MMYKRRPSLLPAYYTPWRVTYARQCVLGSIRCRWRNIEPQVVTVFLQTISQVHVDFIFLHFYIKVLLNEATFRAKITFIEVRMYAKRYKRWINKRIVANRKFLGKWKVNDWKNLNYLKQIVLNQYDSI